MSPLGIASIMAAASFVAALIGIGLHRRLPGHHLDEDSRDVVKNVMGLVATVSALVLGLLVANAQSSYNTLSDELDQFAANLVELNHALVEYGPETAEARTLLIRVMRAEIDRVWPNGEANAAALEAPSDRRAVAGFEATILRLTPTTEAHRYLQRRILELTAAGARTRMLVFNQVGNDLPKPFLVVLAFWLATLFLGFGLFARFNATVLAALLVGALSVGGAMFLILELNRPFDGMMRVSDGSIRNALEIIAR
jgi:hypothetical protein